MRLLPFHATAVLGVNLLQGTARPDYTQHVQIDVQQLKFLFVVVVALLGRLLL